jgi:ABC-type Fe3+/spermidine/putrescine transport system ATPase subunit
VALARALIAGPDLLILDEPIAPLDPRSAAELRDEICRLHAEFSLTTLILTSEPAEALALADRLAVIDFGKVVQVGSPSDVYNCPVDSFVARLMGPANLVQGHAEGLDGRGAVVVRTPLGRLIGRARNGEPPAAGSPVTLVIRPEALGLGLPIPADSNRFQATVDGQVLLGPTRQINLRGPGDWPIVSLTLQAGSDRLREGQSVTVSVSPEFVLVLPSKSIVDL